MNFYTVHDRQNALDSTYALCASWRVGSGRERERLYRFETLLDKDAMIRRLITSRLKDGYRVLYTFVRSGVSIGVDPSSSSPSSEGTPPVGRAIDTA